MASAMVLSRLDYDTGAYPWVSGLSSISLVGVHPVGTQQWVVVHQAYTASQGWIIATRVTGSWTSGDPHSTLTVSAPRYASIPNAYGTSGPYLNAGRVTDFYPSGGTGPAHVTFMAATGTGSGALDVKWHYCTFDLDTGALATVTSGEKSPTDFSGGFYDGGLIPSNILECQAYNAHNKTIAIVWCPDNGYFHVGALHADTGILDNCQQVASAMIRGAGPPYIGYYPFNDIIGYLVGGQRTSDFKWLTYITDYSYAPVNINFQVNPIAYWNNNPAKSQVIWAADSSYFATDVPGSGGVLSVNPRSPSPFVSCYFGHQVTQGPTTSNRQSAWLVSNPLPQRMPVAGWPNGAGYTPHPVTDWPGYSKFITNWLGHKSPSDSSPVYTAAFGYPSAPFINRVTNPAATQPWDVGSVTFAPNPNVQALNIFAANYDTHAGRSPSGTAPPYAPALWVFGTVYAAVGYPLNLWAGAVI